MVYHNRGIVESIRLNPENARVYHNRGIIYRLKIDRKL